jgi:hypothetical protein
MKLTSICAVCALALGTAAVGAAPAAVAAPDDKKVTVTGCAVKGDGDGDGFLLANTVEQTTRTTTSPGTTGATVSSTTSTQMGASRVLYWLDDDDDVVDAHMGHKVEITGELEGDVEDGKIEIERENGTVELEIDADGRKATVRLTDVPSAVGTAGSVDDDEKELKYQVRKLDVKSVRMIAATCQ